MERKDPQVRLVVPIIETVKPLRRSIVCPRWRSSRTPVSGSIGRSRQGIKELLIMICADLPLVVETLSESEHLRLSMETEDT